MEHPRAPVAATACPTLLKPLQALGCVSWSYRIHVLQFGSSTMTFRSRRLPPASEQNIEVNDSFETLVLIYQVVR